MPDPRSVMQEFRTLDAKRLAKGLSPEEERRFAELRDLVGGEAGGGAPRGGFDVNAAAARLRESLLPAGLRNRPPPPPELSPEPEPEPFFPAPRRPRSTMRWVSQRQKRPCSRTPTPRRCSIPPRSAGRAIPPPRGIRTP
jgi:hypothetical protein